MELNQAFAEALKLARARAGIAQDGFLDEVSREVISLFERARRSPRLSQIDAIANRIGMHPVTLVVQCYLHKDPLTPFNELAERVSEEIRILEGKPKNPFRSGE